MSIKDYIPYYKRNIRVAIPVMLAQAGTVSVHLVDNIMVGHVGTTELAAASFAGAIFIVGFVFGMGFIFGLTPLVGQAFGNNDEKEVGKLLNNSIFVNTLLTVGLSIVLFAVSFFMDMMGQPQEVVELAKPYYRILVVSLLPFLFFFMIKQFLEGLGDTKKAMYVTLAANLVNIILNWLLIYGKLGFPELGLNGAAYATFIARSTMPVLLFIWFVRAGILDRYKHQISFKNYQLHEIKKLFRFSLPIGLQLIVEVLAFAFGGIMMGWIGAVPLAAHQIALGLASFTFMITTGVGSATTIRVAHQLGARRYDEMRKAAFASVHLIVIFMGAMGVAFFVFRHQLPYIFSTDIKVIEVAANLLLFAAIFQIADGLQMISISALRAISDVNYALYTSLLCYGLVFLSVSYLFAFVLDFGPSGIWLGFVVSLFLASYLLLKRFDKLSKSFLEMPLKKKFAG